MSTIRSRSRRKKAPPGIIEQKEFSDILMRERERSDRNSHSFSMVVFDVSGLKGGEFRDLAEALMARRRRTDFIGWFDAGHLGVILADCDGNGAQKYVRDAVTRLHEAGCREVESRIFQYRGNNGKHDEENLA